MTIRRRLFAAPLLAIGLLLSACTPTEPPLPDATANAQALANALISGDLGSLPFVDSVSAAVNEYKVVTAGLGGVHPSVEVTDIAYDQQAQVAKVSYSQTYVFGQQWQFPSFATFHYAGSDGWQLIWTPSIVQPALDGWTRLTVSRTAATRGQIIGDDGTPIVYNRDVYKVGIDKANLPADQQDAAARALAKIVGVNADNFAKAVANAGPQQFVVAITFRADQLPDITSVPGALAQPSKLPLAPTKTFAIGLLGTAGEATAEDIDNGGGAVQAGDMVGKSGLQASQNAALSGTPGYTVYLAPRADADVVLPTPAPSSSAQPTPSITDKQVIFQTDPVDGVNLQTTLDIALQTKAETVLSKQSGIASLVVLDSQTGAVLAAANSPASGNNSFATTGRYAPGSTFKVSTALALLRSGMTEDSKIDCPVNVTVGGRQFKNVTGYAPSHNGSITLRQAVAYSCNTAMVNGAMTLGGSDLSNAAASLGIGVDHDLGFPAFLGSVPPTTADVDKAAESFGQANIVASPLAMAAEAASVSAGRTITPYLLVDPDTGQPWQPSASTPTSSSSSSSTATAPVVTSTDGVDSPNNHVTIPNSLPPTTASTTGSTATPSAQPLTDDEVTALRDMMAAVIQIGSGTILQGLAQGAKTGTAEFTQDGQALSHAWMIAFTDKYAIAAYVHEGVSGATSAGPIIKAFLS